MRIRYPFAAAFIFLLISAAWLGLAPLTTSPLNDKVLHLFYFFLLSATGYWTPDLPRRLLLKIVFFFVTIFLSIASEVLQAWLPNDRDFDPLDIAANVVGSGLALTLCSWYHKRMLERRRKQKIQGYGIVPAREGDDDLELGERGVVSVLEEGENEDDGADAWDEIGGSDGANGDIAGQVVDAKPTEVKD